MSFFILGESLDQYLVFGAVEMATDVAIAPRSILGADANSQLQIETGVCLGSEVVVQARWGTLTIEAGVSIGSGVLIIGQGRIGRGTCIGAGSTLINPQIAAQSLIGPDSLVGEMGRLQGTAHQAGAAASTEPCNGQGPSVSGEPPEETAPAREAAAADSDSDRNGHNPSRDNLARVYGQAHVNRLLDSLFPHRRPLDS